MTAGGGPHEPAPLDLDAELRAERAASDHWRRIARQREAEYAQLKHRPTVRALLGAERRLRTLRRPLAAVGTRVRAGAERATLLGASRVPRRATRPSVLVREIQRLEPPPPDPRLCRLVVVGSAVAPELSEAVGEGELVAVGAARDVVDTVRAAIAHAEHPLVGIVRSTTEPLDSWWLARLAAAICGHVVAATPQLVHPVRSGSRRTPHDGFVRSLGLELRVRSDDVPVVRAARAGTRPDVALAPSAVDAGSAACVLFDRYAVERVGGLPAVDDLDAAIVALCARLRVRGGRVVAVPAAVLLDHQPVRRWRDLAGPVDDAGPAWRNALARAGPALFRTARPLPGGQLRFAIAVAAPSAKVAARWGDWQLAAGLAAALERRGHQARVETADVTGGPAGAACDVRLVLRGLFRPRRRPGQRHVLWIISHPESVEDDELAEADLVLVASPRFASHLRTRTGTPVEVLLQATDHHRFHRTAAAPEHEHPITVVAKTRDVLRPVVADCLSVGLRPAIYGGGWERLVDPSLVVADHVDNEELPVVYSSAGVVLNDHWRTMQAWEFVSNRLYDVLACGTPVISDPVPGLAELFDGSVLEYHDAAELRVLVDAVLDDPAAARARAARGHAAVLARHTFDHRAVELLAFVERLRLTAS